MRPLHLLKIVAAAAIGAVVATEAWWLANGYRDASACLNALPALEEQGDLVVDGLKRSSGIFDVIEIDYRRANALGGHPGRLRCAFGDGLDGGRNLLGAEIGGQPIGEARLFFLERFWLEDATAVESGAKRLRTEIPPLVFLAAMIGRPHPSLIGALLCALLGVALLAARRFSTSHRRS
ncbi:hypothetical protein [Pleomorphomonas sp. JP5]|uniref:hypothetical protein n=1 Tax=Pleomorphomonas sp. JP5 TaxID=2942998 RepID=UPI0020430F69|nr:hypothetical protein [Pleomorphomonas sp. JP5]MCM5559963.1 hypothetical protein [Pleomorphomonas sp. JP5]